jgi:polysaccharide export outer membrane protein
MISGVMLGILVFFCPGSEAAPANDTAVSAEEKLSNPEVLFKDFDYIIGPEDDLDIFVWRNKDLSKSVTVRPDGLISLPIIDDVRAGGFTTKELDDVITRKYRVLIKDPQVTVAIKNYRSKRVVVVGEVAQPGVYPIPGSLTVLEAITMAKYDKNRATLRSVMVVRQENGKPAAKRLDLIKALRGQDLKDNIQLKSGDVVFVPSSFIAELNIFIDLFFGKTKPVLDFYMAGYKSVKDPLLSQ